MSRIPSALSVVLLGALLCPAQTPAPAEAAKPARLAPEVAAALAQKTVAAAYPQKARQNHIQGTVVLDVLITETGEVGDSTVVSGDPELTQAAVDSIRQWKYKPYTVDGKPAPVETQVSFVFKINAPLPAPPLGRFRDGQYSNEFFGITYPLSTDWVQVTGLLQAQMPSGSTATSAPRPLLAALHVPVHPTGFSADSSLALVAMDASAQTDAKEYLESVIAALKAQKTGEPRGEIVPIAIAGLTAYRADFKLGKGPKYQSFVSAVTKGYLLRWNFLAASASALDSAVETLAAITRWEPSPSAEQPPLPDNGSTTEVPNSEPTRVRVSSGVTAGLLIKNADPVYPPDAKSAGIQGIVVLHAIIDKNGDVVSLEVVAGPVELVPATVTAVRQWKYTPYKLRGKPIELDTTIEVRFTLRR